jgi:hypothetical protein
VLINYCKPVHKQEDSLAAQAQNTTRITTTKTLQQDFTTTQQNSHNKTNHTIWLLQP